MKSLKKVVLVLIIIAAVNKCIQGDGLDIPNWKFHFPAGSFMGLFLAVALPLDLPNKSVFMAYNFEAIHLIPGNETYVNYPPIVSREGKAFDRKVIYDLLESKMLSYGLSGKNCLLRTICEASLHTMDHNGVLGELLHIVLTPSTSKKEANITDVYSVAEQSGRGGSCEEYNKNCSTSFLNIISWIGHAF